MGAEDLESRRLKTRFWPGDTVYLAVASEELRGFITHTHFSIAGVVDHSVVWEDRDESRHYEAELTRHFVPDYARGVEEAAEGAET